MATAWDVSDPRGCKPVGSQDDLHPAILGATHRPAFVERY